MSFQFVGLNPYYFAQIPADVKPRLCEDTKGIVALDQRGEVQGIATFDTWSASSCMIHIWIRNPFILKHGFAFEVFNYVFNTCGRKLIIGSTPEDNPVALKFIKHMGFEELVRIPDANMDGVACVITQLRKEHCRWIEQERRASNGR